MTNICSQEDSLHPAGQGTSIKDIGPLANSRTADCVPTMPVWSWLKEDQEVVNDCYSTLV